LINPGSGLSFGAYDLAEWTSLHPAVRNGNPALLTPLLLRVPLACWGLIISLGFLNTRFGVAAVIIVLTSIAILPPLEFFTQYRDDPNYQQQFLLALVTLATGITGIAIRSVHVIKPLVIILAFVGAGSSLAGLIQGYRLLEQFKLPTHFGFGGISLIAIYVIVALYLLRINKGIIKQTR
jgi:hypothetical protein